MGDKVIRVHGLPENPLDAATQFYADFAATIRDGLRAQPELNYVILFAPDGKEHRGWQLAAVQDLAREAVPARVNAVLGGDERSVSQALAWLEHAPGVTGQLLPLNPTNSKNPRIGAI